MPKQNDKQAEIVVDPQTKLGRYADGFGIRTKSNMGLIDFILNTPEGDSVVVSRIVMQKEALLKLADTILDSVEVEKTEDAKKKTTKN